MIFYFLQGKRRVGNSFPLYTHGKRNQPAVIVAAGSSRRMQGHDKLWIPLAGRNYARTHSRCLSGFTRYRQHRPRDK